ncbi:TPA: hypothetical protein DEP94_02955 [Candidatus Nomurabacteria bacterium]|nr:hypothetical protein [Candidatus Nomurabacteria bacterium]
MEINIIKNQFIELHNKESQAIFRFCVLRVSDRETALDLTQDIFMRYWDYILKNKEKKIDSGRALLFAIARNCIIDWYRKKKNISLESLVEDSENSFNKEGYFLQDNGGEKIEMEAEAELFIKKIEEVDIKYREAVYLRYVEELTPKEIAEVLKESVNVVSVHINRGLNQLRELLDI